MSDYLGSPRFVVSELVGYKGIKVGSWRAEGLCVTVTDQAYCSQVLGMWTTEAIGNRTPKELQRAKIRGQAAALAAELNAR